MRRHRHRHRCHAHVDTSCKGTHKLQRPANIQLPIALLLGQKLQPHSTGQLKHCLHSCSELSPWHQCWAPGPLEAHLQFSCRQWRRAGTHMRQQCVCQPGQHSLWLSAPRACSRGFIKDQFVLAAICACCRARQLWQRDGCRNCFGGHVPVGIRCVVAYCCS
jgi:hypothetical protein